MKGKYIFWPFLFVVMAAGLTAAVMLLWNWLMPAIFDLREISFWEALGILVLSKILFGGHWGKRGRCGCGGGHSSHGWKDKFKSKWAHMSEEDRKKWEEKCGTKWQ
jgi:hypothetical protein